MAPAGEDLVYALHDFEAENEDELSFSAGEKIVVMERDDLYGDGWFQGRNTAGEVGLFPQSYTSPNPPSLDSSPAPASPTRDAPIDSRQAGPGAGSDTPEPVMAANLNQVQQALDRLQVERQRGKDSASVRSRVSQVTRGSDDEDDSGVINGNGPNGTSPSKGMGGNHRAALAARAVENAERAAREEQERAEQRRRADEEAYAKARSEGLVEGLQLSDESESEDEDLLPLPVGMKSTLSRTPEEVEPTSPPTVPSAEIVPPTPTDPETNKAVQPLEAAALTPEATPSADDESLAGRPRAETVSDGYAESTYSNYSIPNSTSSPNIETVASSPPTAALSVPIPDEDAREELITTTTPAEPNGTATPQPNGHSFLSNIATAPVAAASAVGAGAVGLATAAFVSTRTETPEPTPFEPVNEQVLTPAQEVAAASEAPVPVPAPTVVASVDEPSTSAPPGAPRSSTPPPAPAPASEPLPAPTTRALPAPINTLASTPIAAAFVASPAASTVSRSSSRVDTAPTTVKSTGTAETSPQVGSSSVLRDLPHDPRVWTVDDVVEWAKAKGFDTLTLAKFQEHEISGDVLLEMDVAMLKEIDLVAFGKRVHIYNAIKELKHRLPRDLMSPAMSGYEPDSPGTLSFASPGQMSFTSPMSYPVSTFGDSQADRDVQGLGFEDDGSSRAASSLSRNLSNALRPQRSKSIITASPVSHKRSATVATQDSLGTDGGLDKPIPEEETDAERAPKKVIAAAAVIPSRERTKSSRPKSTVITKAPSRSQSDTSVPGSPNLSRKKKDSVGSERSFFGATLGRSRKPPPRVPSALLLDSDGRVPRPPPAGVDAKGNRARLALNSAKRSTRLFGSFGSGSEKNSGVESMRKASSSTLASGRDAPSSMSPKVVDAATSEMLRQQAPAVTDGFNLLEKIGSPDYSGWMRKKGEKYNTWKQRFFVLKGVHLYYLKTESEQKVKGFINLKGYRVISDADVHVGEFGFKIVHDTERPHYFSAAEQVTVRNWMKEIMKATIGRNYGDAVVSSCHVDTMPLKVAQTMNPRPRPPSPTERARVQKERYAAGPKTLSQKDAQILMDFSPGSPLMSGSPFVNNNSPLLGSASTFMNGSSPLPFPGKPASSPSSSPMLKGASDGSKQSPSSPLAPAAATLSPSPAPSPIESSPVVASRPPLNYISAADQGLLNWINSSLPHPTPRASDLSASLRSGEILVRLVEQLSGQDSGISDVDFSKFPGTTSAGDSLDPAYFDTMFAVFDYLSPMVDTNDVSMHDMLTGSQPELTVLLDRIRTKFDA